MLLLDILDFASSIIKKHSFNLTVDFVTYYVSTGTRNTICCRFIVSLAFETIH